jgi:hypothetical protein
MKSGGDGVAGSQRANWPASVSGRLVQRAIIRLINSLISSKKLRPLPKLLQPSVESLRRRDFFFSYWFVGPLLF